MIKFDIQLFGGRGANFSLKKNTAAVNVGKAKIMIPKGTYIKNVIVIAGAGSKRKIDEVNSLVNKYGGNKKNWSKRVGFAKINNKKAELHYYQNKKDNIGRVKYKIKRWIE